jgi:hypothetical protein
MTEDLYAVRGPAELQPGFYAVGDDGRPLPGSDGPLDETSAQSLVERYGGRVLRVDAKAV